MPKPRKSLIAKANRTAIIVAFLKKNRLWLNGQLVIGLGNRTAIIVAFF